MNQGKITCQYFGNAFTSIIYQASLLDGSPDREVLVPQWVIPHSIVSGQCTRGVYVLGVKTHAFPFLVKIRFYFRHPLKVFVDHRSLNYGILDCVLFCQVIKRLYGNSERIKKTSSVINKWKLFNIEDVIFGIPSGQKRNLFVIYTRKLSTNLFLLNEIRYWIKISKKHQSFA